MPSRKRQLYGECGCGCGKRLSTPEARYALGHAPKVPLIDRLMAKVIVTETGCWEFTGCLLKGYGQIGDGVTPRGTVLTHRASYEYHKGPIEPGLHLDHLCRNPPCCNPDHLEPVTPRENFLRGVHRNAAAHAAGTCVEGHDQATEAAFRPDGRVMHCRACKREKYRLERDAG